MISSSNLNCFFSVFLLLLAMPLMYLDFGILDIGLSFEVLLKLLLNGVSKFSLELVPY
jgi:hypothetical protein